MMSDSYDDRIPVLDDVPLLSENGTDFGPSQSSLGDITPTSNFEIAAPSQGIELIEATKRIDRLEDSITRLVKANGDLLARIEELETNSPDNKCTFAEIVAYFHEMKNNQTQTGSFDNLLLKHAPTVKSNFR
jgi:hypothetical protein